MILVAIAWSYVVLMMALSEAMSPQGSVLGAMFTVLLYGVLPLSIVLYVMATPARRRARRERDARVDAGLPPASGAAGPSSVDPHRSRETAGAPVAAEREET